MRPARRWVVPGAVLSLMLASAQLGGPPRASSRPYTPLTASIAGSEEIAAVRGGARGPGHQLRTARRSKPRCCERSRGHRLAPGSRSPSRPSSRISSTGSYQGASSCLFLTPTRRARDVSAHRRDAASYEESEASQLDAAVPLVPAWSDAPDGLASLIVPDHEPATAKTRNPFRYKVGEAVLLWSGYRNVSGRDIVLRYRRLAARIAHSLGPPRGAERHREPSCRWRILMSTRQRSGSSSPETRTGSRKRCDRERRSSSTWIGSTSPRRGGGTGSGWTFATTRCRVRESIRSGQRDASFIPERRSPAGRSESGSTDGSRGRLDVRAACSLSCHPEARLPTARP